MDRDTVIIAGVGAIAGYATCCITRKLTRKWRAEKVKKEINKHWDEMEAMFGKEITAMTRAATETVVNALYR